MTSRQKIKQWVSDIFDGKGHAIHAVSGNNHTVAILSMRVIIVQDGPDTWFAQSLDINYAASGLSVEDVKTNFELGLSATIKANLERFGNIDKLMQSPALEDWAPLISEHADEFEFSIGESHILDQYLFTTKLPYREISYIQQSKKAA